jgi:hydrogenase maturation protease
MIAVIACGNLLRGDDGVGAYLLMELAKSGIPAGVALIEAATATLDILSYVEHADKVLIIDAVMGGNPPGTIYRVPIDELASVPSNLTLHDLSPLDILAIGRSMRGKEFTDRLVILGVEVKSTQFKLGLSPEVEEALPRLVALVREEMTDRGRP